MSLFPSRSFGYRIHATSLLDQIFWNFSFISTFQGVRGIIFLLSNCGYQQNLASFTKVSVENSGLLEPLNVKASYSRRTKSSSETLWKPQISVRPHFWVHSHCSEKRLVASSCPSVCLYAYPHVSSRCPPDGCTWYLMGTFMKICSENPNEARVWQKYRKRLMKTCFVL